MTALFQWQSLNHSERGDKDEGTETLTQTPSMRAQQSAVCEEGKSCTEESPASKPVRRWTLLRPGTMFEPLLTTGGCFAYFAPNCGYSTSKAALLSPFCG